MIFKISFFLVLLLVVTSFSFQNSAEARSPEEPCSYLSKNSFIKISAEPLNCKKIDYWVPMECGKIAGLYLTDSRCQAPAPIPAPIPEAAATSVHNQPIPNPMNDGGQHNNHSQNDLHTSPQVNCGEGTVLRNNICIIDNNSDATNTDGSNDIESVIGLGLIIGTISALIVWRFGKRVFSNRNHVQQLTEEERRRLREILVIQSRTSNTGISEEPDKLRVSPEEFKRIKEFENSFKTVGKSDPEYFLHVKSGAFLIDASKRGNELYGINTIIHGRVLKILKYRDPSTGQLYISPVPDEINEADDGMAWKFHITREEYDRMGAEG